MDQLESTPSLQTVYCSTRTARYNTQLSNLSPLLVYLLTPSPPFLSVYQQHGRREAQRGTENLSKMWLGGAFCGDPLPMKRYQALLQA